MATSVSLDFEHNMAIYFEKSMRKYQNLKFESSEELVRLFTSSLASWPNWYLNKKAAVTHWDHIIIQCYGESSVLNPSLVNELESVRNFWSFYGKLGFKTEDSLYSWSINCSQCVFGGTRPFSVSSVWRTQRSSPHVK